MPPCLIGIRDHDYDELGLCRECGTSFLEKGGWGSFHMRRCSNQSCRHIIAKLAKKCPKCEQEQVVTVDVSFYRYFAFIVLPFVRHIAKPREGNLSVFDWIFLFSGLVMGVLLGETIRNSPQSNSASTGSLTFTSFDILLAIFISFIILPTIFKDSVFKSDTPLIVRFGLCIQQGAFSDLLVQGIQKGLEHGATP